MQLPEFIDHRIWFALGVLLLWGLLAVWHHRLRQDLRRNIKGLHFTLGSLRRFIEEDRERIDLEHRSLSLESASAASSCRAEVEQLRQDIEALRHAVEADIGQLADAVISLEARPPQTGMLHQAPDVPGKTALFTLRSDIEKLRAEVAALQASRGSRPPPPPQQAGDRRPKLPRTEQVLAALDERRGDAPPVAPDDPKTLN